MDKKIGQLWFQSKYEFSQNWAVIKSSRGKIYGSKTFLIIALETKYLAVNFLYEIFPTNIAFPSQISSADGCTDFFS